MYRSSLPNLVGRNQPRLVIAPVCDSLEAVHGLLPQPLDHAGVVVAEAHDVIEGREAVWLA